MPTINCGAVWHGWTITNLIGSGSYGTVYEVERRMFDDVEKSALKHISVPHDEGEVRAMKSEGETEESITRTFTTQAKDIFNEYKMLAKLNDCPNVVTCHDVECREKENAYGWDIMIRMELLTPFEDYLSENLSMPESEIIKVGKDMCKALEACRRLNIIHRDVKPQNIFISKNGNYKLGDFGVARFSEKTGSATVRIGTYTYMAPEVYNGRKYGFSADIYSLGMVLYWLLNGRKAPFVSVNTKTEKETALARRMGGEPIPEPVNGSSELQRIVLKACAYDPKERYQHASEMLKDLEAMKALDGVAVEPKAEEEKTAADTATNDEGIAEAEETDNEDTLGAFGEKRRAEPGQNREEPLAEDEVPPTVGGFGEKRKDELKQESEGFAPRMETPFDNKGTVGAFNKKKPDKKEKTEPSPVENGVVDKEPSPQKKEDSKRIFIGIAAAVAVVVLAGILWKGIGKRTTDTSTKDSSITTQAPSITTQSAEPSPYAGTYENGIRWSLSPDGVLTFSGQGEIPDATTVWSGDSLHSKLGCPWNDKRNDVVEIIIEDGITCIGFDAFSYCENLVRVTIPNSVTELHQCAFRGCVKLKDLILPDSITSIAIQAFQSCGFEMLTIPESVERIKDYAFVGCDNMTSISIPNSVKTIGVCSFGGCSLLKSVIIPDSIEIIETGCFQDCTSLCEITIPASVNEIEYLAFDGCTNLQDIYYLGSKEQWDKIVIGNDNASLINADIHCDLAVPEGFSVCNYIGYINTYSANIGIYPEPHYNDANTPKFFHCLEKVRVIGENEEWCYAFDEWDTGTCGYIGKKYVSQPLVSGASTVDGYICAETYVQLDEAAYSRKNAKVIGFTAGESLANIVRKYFDNVVIENGMLMSIDELTASSDFSRYIAINKNWELASEGVETVPFKDGDCIEFVETTYKDYVIVKDYLTHDEYLAATGGELITIQAAVQFISLGEFDPDLGKFKVSMYLADEDGGYYVYRATVDYEQDLVLHNQKGTVVRVVGHKREYGGMHEITDVVSIEILDEPQYIRPAVNITDMARKDLIAYQSLPVKIEGAKVAASQNGEAFMYKWNGTGMKGNNDDLYFDIIVNNISYTVMVESVECPEGSEVYNKVINLGLGDTISIEGFLYWYNNGPEIHVHKITDIGK